MSVENISGGVIVKCDQKAICMLTYISSFPTLTNLKFHNFLLTFSLCSFNTFSNFDFEKCQSDLLGFQNFGVTMPKGNSI